MTIEPQEPFFEPEEEPVTAGQKQHRSPIEIAIDRIAKIPPDRFDELVETLAQSRRGHYTLLREAIYHFETPEEAKSL